MSWIVGRICCRAGSTTAYSFGDDAGKISEHAWWGGLEGANANNAQSAHRVGKKKPKPRGLYDMYGKLTYVLAAGSSAGNRAGHRLMLLEVSRSSIGDFGAGKHEPH
jgi:hypothetical protein